MLDIPSSEHDTSSSEVERSGVELDVSASKLKILCSQLQLSGFELEPSGFELDSRGVRRNAIAPVLHFAPLGRVFKPWKGVSVAVAFLASVSIWRQNLRFHR